MNYAQQRELGHNLIGIALVVVIHIVLIYALVNGLGRKVIEGIKQPLHVNLIQEAKPLPPPPPPPKIEPPVKKVAIRPPVHVPPPVYVPPPEVKVEAPPPPAPVEVTTSKPPPPVEVVQAPVPPPAPAVKAEPPAIVNVGVACPNHLEVRSSTPYPPQALSQGISGDVLVEFLVSPDGAIGSINIVKSTNKLFNSSVISAVGKLHCVGQGQSVKVRVPFAFKLDN